LRGLQRADYKTAHRSMHDLETRFAPTPDGHVAYQVLGSGPRDLVFVPNWGSNVDVMWEEPSFARELKADDVGGIAVHIGARVAEEAGAGEVLGSSTVKDLVAGSGIRFADRGQRALKGVPGDWRLFAVEPGRAA
jgi:hypothetical protein